MANICSTAIYFYSTKEEPVERFAHDLAEKIDKVHRKARLENKWELEVLAEMYYPEMDTNFVRCKGDIEDDGFSVGCLEGFYNFVVWVQSPWSAYISIWNKIVSDFYPDVKIAYVAEEAGCGYFVRWDETPNETFCDAHYYVDGVLPVLETRNGDVCYIEDHDFYSLEQVRDFMKQTFGIEIPDDMDDTRDIGQYVRGWLKAKEGETEYEEGLCFVIEKYEDIAPGGFSLEY